MKETLKVSYVPHTLDVYQACHGVKDWLSVIERTYMKETLKVSYVPHTLDV